MATLINDEIVLMSLLDVLQSSKKKSKTLQQRKRQWNHNKKKSQLNEELSRQLPIFSYKQTYELIFINSMSFFFGLIRLRELAHRTAYFTVDTEIDDFSKQPALIQVEFVSSLVESDKNEQKKHIIVFEMFHMPSIKSPIYLQIQRLINTIFHPSKTLFAWGNEKKELIKFNIYPLFKCIPLHQLEIINVQDEFKYWYNDTYPHDSYCSMAIVKDKEDDPSCTCSHRPYKQQNNPWALQRAVANVLEEFLDKSLTVSNWGIGLDIRLMKSSLTEKENQERLKLINYATNDCFATTKLASIIGPSYLFAHH
ncbi:hypothetical protein I4U23_017156 [Adineta vaga]|nr:hypothetical protein I4U23_017156 [Adineta vaga]